MITVNGSCGSGRGVGGECSVNGWDGERLLCKLSPTFSWKHWRKELLRRKPGAYFSTSQPSPKMATISFGVGSHLGVPCRGALLGRVVRGEGKFYQQAACAFVIVFISSRSLNRQGFSFPPPRPRLLQPNFNFSQWQITFWLRHQYGGLHHSSTSTN